MPERPDRAIALRYSGAGAPKVTAAGRGLVADRIVALAEEHGVPVRRDPALLQALATLQVGQEIPEDLYVAVAEILAWAYGLDGLARRRNTPIR